MSDTFVLAAHLPMPMSELAAFLKRRPTAKRLVRRGTAMFEGWGWQGKKSDWRQGFAAVSNQELLAGLVAETASGQSPMTLVFAHDRRRNGFDFYFTLAGFASDTLQALLLALASAGKSFRDGAEAHVVLLAETSGRLKAKSVLSVLSIDRQGARFVGPDELEIAPLLQTLKPAEKRFAKAISGNPADTLDSDAILVAELRPRSAPAQLEPSGHLAADLLALDHDEEWWGRDFSAAQKQLMRRARGERAEAAPALLEVVRSGRWGSAVTAARCVVALAHELGAPTLAVQAIAAMDDWSDETAQHGCSEALLKEVPGGLGPEGAKLLADAIEERLRTSGKLDRWAFLFLLNHPSAAEQLTRLSAGGKQPRHFTAEDVNRYRLTADLQMWRRWVFDGVVPDG